MDLRRIETTNTIWQFDFDRMVYIRIPKNESTFHPEPFAKPYEGHEVAFDRIELGRFDPADGMQQFFVHNAGVKWGEGAVTQSWAVPNEDLGWANERP